MTDVSIEAHPELDAALFVTRFPQPIGSIRTPTGWHEWFRLDEGALRTAPLHRDDETRAAVRDLLRYGGYKPTGRGKPASEYLIKAAEPDGLHSINVAVDACNVVSLHSGLPISVIDLDLAVPPLRIGVAFEDAEYAFNPAGQTILLGGLLCLHDSAGPCANAVKDSQRTKTSEATRTTLSVIWGTHRLPGRTAAALAWYRELFAELGCSTETILG